MPLTSIGAKMVLATHAEGIVLYDGVQLYSASFHIPPKMEGRTGRGDTGMHYIHLLDFKMLLF